MSSRFLSLFIPGFAVGFAVVGTVALLAGADQATRPAFQFSTLRGPAGEVKDLYATGISGNNVVGYYRDANFLAHGFLYDTAAQTYKTLRYPDAGFGANRGTFPMGISEGKVVGYSETDGDEEHGYLYDTATKTYSMLDHPDAKQGNYLAGISGGNIVGFFRDDDYNAHGFIFDGKTYKTLDDPEGAKGPHTPALNGTFACGISGGNIVGYFQDGAGKEDGFLSDGKDFTTMVYPAEISSVARLLAGIFHDPLVQGPVQLTDVRGMADGVFVGYYRDATGYHGFISDGITYTTLNDPAGFLGSTQVMGISAGKIVGFSKDERGMAHGFLATPVGRNPWPWQAGAVGLDLAMAILAVAGWRKFRVGN